MANEYKSIYTGEEVDESVEISKKALTTDNIVQTTGPSPSQVMSQQAVTVALRTAKAATVQVGTTTTGPAGSNASVTNSGTEYDAILDFVIPRGDTGEKGNGITSIEKTSSSGIIDTYTITYDNGNTETFQITNADQIELRYLNGELQWKYETEDVWITLFAVDDNLSTTSNNPIQNQAVANALNSKANLTGENTFNGEQTIQGNVYIGGQVNVPNGPVTVQNINVAESISSLQNNVSSINNKINTNVVNDIETSVSENNFSLIKTLINLNTQETTQQSTNIPLANSTTAGLMSSSDFSSLQDLEDRVGNLEGKTTRLLYTASTNPTASDINSFVTGLGYTAPFEGIAVVVDETFHIWHYYDNNNIGWRDDGVDTVSNFTNTTAGIIKGSTENGKIFAETDGTGSVNGWDALNTNVTNLSSDISNLDSQVTSNTTNITSLQNNKLDKNQGSANAGKLLMVGENGEVSPQNIEGGTIVNVNNQPQGTLNFTSDPQGQIDNIVNNTTVIGNSNGGFAGGDATLTTGGLGAAIGNNASSIHGGAIGNSSSTTVGGAIGNGARSTYGGAIGGNSRAGFGFSGGYEAQVAQTSGQYIDAIQLGTGTNSTPKSLQVYDDNLYNAETHKIGVALLDAIYPVDAVYISVNNTSPASLFGGSWEALDEGYALWTTTTANTGGDTIAAGLPNIAGYLDWIVSWTGIARGAFKLVESNNGNSGTGDMVSREYTFNASDGECGTQKATSQNVGDINYANNVYGKSDTVQPPAIRVFVWKRIS